MMKTKILVLIGLITLALALNCYAEIPHLMNFQGKATDKAGAPLNGSYNLTFRIYNHQTAGTLKWSETHQNITITNGIFQVMLGSVTPLNLDFNENYWISVKVNTDDEMSPRTQLASVAYAYKAEKADSLIDTPAIPFYKKGFEIEFVDFNTIKVTPGVIEIAGKMFTTTSYSNNLILESLVPPANKDWVHGSKTNDSFAYVYAYNHNGQIDFKLSDEAPDLSDNLGDIAKQPLQYQRYPDTAEGIYYRCLGRVKVNATGLIIKPENLIDDANATSRVFDGFEAGFAGDGSDGDVTILSDTDISGLVKQYNNLTINPGVTLVAKNSIIGVKGTLTIKGTISAKGGGGKGGYGISGQRNGSLQNQGASGDITGCGGSGGGGGTNAENGDRISYGSKGGDAQQLGGNGGSGTDRAGCPGLPVDSAFFSSAKVWHSRLCAIGKGAGGGGGGGWASTGGEGGCGGGYLYIECENFDFQSNAAIDVRGNNGGSGEAGGGGGGGGFAWVRYGNLIANNGTWSVAGGFGGSGSRGGGSGGAGQYYLSQKKDRFYF